MRLKPPVPLIRRTVGPRHVEVVAQETSPPFSIASAIVEVVHRKCAVADAIASADVHLFPS